MSNKMKRASIFVFCMVCFVCFCISGCSDGLDLQDEVAWKKVCTHWGVPTSKVKDMMRTYIAKNATSTILTYKGKGAVEAISYQFAEDSLCAVAVLLNAENIDKAEIRSSFRPYESLGENNASELFLNYNGNSLITITSLYQDDKEYISVGYADFGDVVINNE